MPGVNHIRVCVIAIYGLESFLTLPCWESILVTGDTVTGQRYRNEKTLQARSIV